MGGCIQDTLVSSSVLIVVDAEVVMAVELAEMLKS